MWAPVKTEKRDKESKRAMLFESFGWVETELIQRLFDLVIWVYSYSEKHALLLALAVGFHSDNRLNLGALPPPKTAAQPLTTLFSTTQSKHSWPRPPQHHIPIDNAPSSPPTTSTFLTTATTSHQPSSCRPLPKGPPLPEQAATKTNPKSTSSPSKAPPN